MSQPLPLRANPMQLRGYGDSDGAIIAHAGRYSRECVLLAFEMIGGVERMADWADKNPTEFYTRLFTKTVTREVELSAGGGIEELLLQLNKRSGTESLRGPYETVDAEFEIE